MRPSSVTQRPEADPRRPGREGPERALIGQVFLGKYRLARFLGEGSNAHVFLAQSVHKADELVVVKRIKDHVVATPRFRQFFDNEVTSMKSFRHPYAVRLLDATLDDPLGTALVLEFIPGQTLDAVLHQQRRLPVERAIRVVAHLCHALDAAHKAGIVHRDIKPANMMVLNVGTPAESVKVMDFGFAGFTAKPHIQLAELTGMGAIFACGTPAYVSPEMVRGDAVDGRGDLYSMGVLFFEMLTGRLPFDHATQEEMLAAHVQAEPPKFNKVGAGDVPAVAEGVVRMLLSKYPSERPASGRAVLELLSRVTGYDIWEATKPAPPAPGTKPPESDVIELVACTADRDKPAEERPEDKFVLSDRFEAMLPERLAAAKLRGFIEDVNGVAVSSEPGLIRVRLDVPTGARDVSAKGTGSGLIAWFSTRVQTITSGKEPIELDLEMQKIGPDRVAVQVSFRPMSKWVPTDVPTWSARCEGYYSVLRKYLMAEASVD